MQAMGGDWASSNSGAMAAWVFFDGRGHLHDSSVGLSSSFAGEALGGGGDPEHSLHGRQSVHSGRVHGRVVAAGFCLC